MCGPLTCLRSQHGPNSPRPVFFGILVHCRCISRALPLVVCFTSGPSCGFTFPQIQLYLLSSATRDHLSLMASQPTHLVPELLDSIIDYLHDDVVSLSACTLASSSFLPRARYHLFHSITLSISDDQSPELFLQFLKSSPHLVGYIRCFSIRHRFSLDSFYSPPPVLSDYYLAHLLSSLPALSQLSCSHFSWNRATPSQSLLSSPPSHRFCPQNLDLSFVLTPNLNSLAYLLAFFPDISALRIIDPYGTFPQAHVPSDIPIQDHSLSFNLTTLALITWNSDSLKLIRQSISRRSICTLLVSCSSHPTEGLQALIDDVGPSLGSLKIWFQALLPSGGRHSTFFNVCSRM